MAPKINHRTAKKLAREYLNIETLQPANVDRLDFHTLSVRQISNLIDAAWLEGYTKAKIEFAEMF